MEGEAGADSEAPRASSPRPPLAYEHLAFFEDTRDTLADHEWVRMPVWTRPPLAYEHLAFFEDKRCTLAEHEWAVKQILYIRTLGIAHLRGFASRAPIFQMLQDSRHEGPKRTIWRYLDVPKPVELEVEIVIPATSMYSSIATADNMLAGRKVWWTKEMPDGDHQVESVVLGVAAGSRVTSFDVASACQYGAQMCVEEVAADGTVGAMLIVWNDYGTFSGGFFSDKPSDYTPATIAMETTATRFKVSVRQTYISNNTNNSPGVAIFRATGVAP